MKAINKAIQFYNYSPAIKILLWYCLGILLGMRIDNIWILLSLAVCGITISGYKIYLDKHINHNISSEHKSITVIKTVHYTKFQKTLLNLALPFIIVGIASSITNIRILSRIDNNPIREKSGNFVVIKGSKHTKNQMVIIKGADSIKRLLYCYHSKKILDKDTITITNVKNVSLKSTSKNNIYYCIKNNTYDAIKGSIISLKNNNVQSKEYQDINILTFVRQWIINRIDKYNLPDKEKALIKAVSFGYVSDDNGITLKKDYSAAGVAHILVVSGFHLGVVFFLVEALIYLISSIYYRRVLHYIIIIVTIWIFCAITGFAIATVRAGIFITLYSIGKLVQVRTYPINTLFVTAIIMSIYHPLTLFTTSAQLSFSAVLSIFLFYRFVYNIVPPISNFLLKYLWSTIAVSISVLPLLAPLLSYYFGFLSLGSIFLSLPLTLVIVLIIPLGWVMAFVADINLTHKVVEVIANTLCSYSNNLVKAVGTDNIFRIDVSAPLSVCILLYLVCLMCGIMIYDNKLVND